MSMIRQSIRPVSRTVLRTPSRQVRFGSSSSPTSPKQSSNPIIPLLGIGAIVIGGIAYFYVPFKHDLKDRASDAVKGEAKPSTLKAISTQTDVRKSVLDQDSLKEPLHRRGPSSGATPSPAEKKGASNLPLEDKVPKVPETIEAKAEEAKAPAQTAFNEETGEINWDCPCLGGMADGPCGEQFKAAFSCFVYSEKEPKGVECVDKFKLMQDCFREHPDVYGEDIDDDEEESSKGHDVTSREFKPEPAKKTPPPNSPILATTPETTPSKGVAHLVPTSKRADKGPGGLTPPIGEGTLPAPGSKQDKAGEHKDFNAKE